MRVTVTNKSTVEGGVIEFTVDSEVLDKRTTLPQDPETGECPMWLTNEDMMALEDSLFERTPLRYPRRTIAVESDHMHLAHRLVTIAALQNGQYLDAPGVAKMRAMLDTAKASPATLARAPEAIRIICKQEPHY